MQIRRVSVRSISIHAAVIAAFIFSLFPTRLFNTQLVSSTKAQTSNTGQCSLDLAIVLDRSGSMSIPVNLSNPSSETKMAAAKDATRGVLDFFAPNNTDSDADNDVQIALATYSSGSQLNSELSNNFDTIRASLRDIQPVGQTAIGKGIRDGRQELTSNRARPVSETVHAMILLSDGQENQNSDPLGQATQAKNAGIEIFTIGIGPDTTILMRQVASTDPPQHYYHSNTGDDLRELFQTIASRLCDNAPPRVVFCMRDGQTLRPIVGSIRLSDDALVNRGSDYPYLVPSQGFNRGCTSPSRINIQELIRRKARRIDRYSLTATHPQYATKTQDWTFSGQPGIQRIFVDMLPAATDACETDVTFVVNANRSMTSGVAPTPEQMFKDDLLPAIRSYYALTYQYKDKGALLTFPNSGSPDIRFDDPNSLQQSFLRMSNLVFDRQGGDLMNTITQASDVARQRFSATGRRQFVFVIGDRDGRNLSSELQQRILEDKRNGIRYYGFLLQSGNGFFRPILNTQPYKGLADLSGGRFYAQADTSTLVSALDSDRCRIWGYKFNDLNTNGSWEINQNETGLGRWTIQLLGQGIGLQPQETTTSASQADPGFFEFTNLRANTPYKVIEILSPSQINEGWQQTTPSDPYSAPTTRGLRSIGNAKGGGLNQVRFCAVNSASQQNVPDISVSTATEANQSVLITKSNNDGGCTDWMNAQNQFTQGNQYRVTTTDPTLQYSSYSGTWTRSNDARQTVPLPLNSLALITTIKSANPNVLGSTSTKFLVTIELDNQSAVASPVQIANLTIKELPDLHFLIDTSVVPTLTAPGGAAQPLPSSSYNEDSITYAIQSPVKGKYRLVFGGRVNPRNIPSVGTHSIDLSADTCLNSAHLEFSTAATSNGCSRIDPGTITVLSNDIIIDSDVYLRQQTFSSSAHVRIEPNALVVTGRGNVRPDVAPDLKVQNYTDPSTGKLNWSSFKQQIDTRVTRAVDTHALQTKSCLTPGPNDVFNGTLDFTQGITVWLIDPASSCHLRLGNVTVKGTGTIINKSSGANLSIYGDVTADTNHTFGYIALQDSAVISLRDQASLKNATLFSKGSIKVAVDQETSIASPSPKSHNARFAAQRLEVPQSGPRVTVILSRPTNNRAAPLLEFFELPSGGETP